jgi:NAD(P)H dehydrogenase (quinone)
MMRKILITGVSGKLGKNVVKILMEKIYAKNIAVLLRDKHNDLIKQYKSKNFEVRVADYDNLASLNTAFHDIYVLYFISGNDIENRLPQHKHVIEAAKSAGIKHILYTSTVRKDESESAPLATVVGSHKQTEEWIKASGITYTILKHNLYSEVIEMLIGHKEQLLKTKTIYLPTGLGSVAFAPRKDFAEAAVNILLNLINYENVVLEFNGSEKLNFVDIAASISKIVKVPIEYISPKNSEFVIKMTETGLPDSIIDMLNAFSLGIANGEFDQHSNDLEIVLKRKSQSIFEYLEEVYK